MVDFNVNGKTVLITGGTRGLGYACGEKLLLNGASRIIITSRKDKACQEARAGLEALAKSNDKKCEIIAIASDISDDESIQQFVDQVYKRVDKLHVLFANAGASWGAPFAEHPVKAVRKVLDLNVTGVFHTIQLFAPLLEKTGTSADPARVIINGSIAGLAPSAGMNTYGYLASKAGIIHLGKSLAIELAEKNITVNSIAPGFIPSKLSNGLLDMIGDVMADQNPRKRLGVNDDVSDTVLFLSSKQSNYINGVVIPIDGGSNLIGTPKL